MHVRMHDNGTVEINNPMFLNEEPEPSLIFDSDKVNHEAAYAYLYPIRIFLYNLLVGIIYYATLPIDFSKGNSF